MEHKLEPMHAPMDETLQQPHCEEPQGEIEKSIARAWKQVFHLECIGRDDNFFELGGNSLTGMQLTELLATELSLYLPVVALFLNPTIRELAQLIITRPQV